MPIRTGSQFRYINERMNLEKLSMHQVAKQKMKLITVVFLTILGITIGMILFYQYYVTGYYNITTLVIWFI